MSKDEDDFFARYSHPDGLKVERYPQSRNTAKAPVRGMDLSSMSQEDTIALLMQKLESKIHGVTFTCRNLDEI